MGNKNGWGAAKDGKVHTESDAEYGHDPDTKPSSKSKQLDGLYSKYQGKKKA